MFKFTKTLIQIQTKSNNFLFHRARLCNEKQSEDLKLPKLNPLKYIWQFILYLKSIIF
jgi:hypothetical protein